MLSIELAGAVILGKSVVASPCVPKLINEMVVEGETMMGRVEGAVDPLLRSPVDLTDSAAV